MSREDLDSMISSLVEMFTFMLLAFIGLGIVGSVMWLLVKLGVWLMELAPI